MPRWYVVFIGSAPGVYEDWDAAKVAVEGHSGNKHSWYPSLEDALAAYNHFQDTGIMVSRHEMRQQQQQQQVLGCSSARQVLEQELVSGSGSARLNRQVWQQELEPGSSSINAALEGNRTLLRRLRESEDRNLQLQNELASLRERMGGLEDENLGLSVLLKESQEANQKRVAELVEDLAKLVSKLHINKGDLNE